MTAIPSFCASATDPSVSANLDAFFRHGLACGYTMATRTINLSPLPVWTFLFRIRVVLLLLIFVPCRLLILLLLVFVLCHLLVLIGWHLFVFIREAVWASVTWRVFVHRGRRIQLMKLGEGPTF